MKFLHTMVRVSSVEASLDFYCNKLGLVESRRYENDKGRYTLIFVAAPETPDAQIELTYNWDPENYSGGRNFGHLAFEVDDIYATCDTPDEGGRRHQPAAARRPHGLRPLARRHFDRAAEPGRCPAAQGAVDLHAQHGQLVAHGAGGAAAVAGLWSATRRASNAHSPAPTMSAAPTTVVAAGTSRQNT